MEDNWDHIVAGVLQPGALFTSFVECSAYAIALELVKYAAGKMWHAYITRKQQRMECMHPYSTRKRGQYRFTYDDETEGIKSVLEDCWPETLSSTFERSNGDILNHLNTFENLNDFYTTSRELMAESEEKEIKLFRHNAFNIIKEDCPCIVKSLEQKNKIEVFISGTQKNLEKSTRTELDFLRDTLAAQKLLLMKGGFDYSSDFDLNLLLNHVDSLFSLVLLLGILRKGYENLTIFLNNASSSIRGHVIEDGELLFVRFPRDAPEYLGVGCSSKSSELRNRILIERSQWNPMDVSDEKVLTEIVRNRIYTIENLLDRNYELGNITRKKKEDLDDLLYSLGLSNSQAQVNQDALENAYSEFRTAVVGNKRKAFEMHKLWEEYNGIKPPYEGDFGDFLKERSRIQVRKYEVKGSQISFLFHE